jgi:hypothetical protein
MSMGRLSRLQLEGHLEFLLTYFWQSFESRCTWAFVFLFVFRHSGNTIGENYAKHVITLHFAIYSRTLGTRSCIQQNTRFRLRGDVIPAIRLSRITEDDPMKKKLKYERPMLLDLNRDVMSAEGRCSNGSAQTQGACNSGANPQGNCGSGALPQDACAFGDAAYARCSAGQGAATGGCQNGDTPVAQCASGSTK